MPVYTLAVPSAIAAPAVAYQGRTSGDGVMSTDATTTSPVLTTTAVRTLVTKRRTTTTLLDRSVKYCTPDDGRVQAAASSRVSAATKSSMSCSEVSNEHIHRTSFRLASQS